MTHTLPQLPYAEDALAPRMSKETIEYHHGKHQRTYVDNLNKLIAGTPYENMSLEEIIVRADGPIFNNAAQDWNHTFFFFTLSPTPKSMPSGPLAEAIDRDFGSFDAFKEQFTSAAAALFGSGWTWLVKDRDGKLSIRPMPNAGNPLRDGLTPLLTVDVWEHAYYIDYRNRRAEFLKNFWDLDRLENSRRTVRKIESRPTETQRPGRSCAGPRLFRFRKPERRSFSEQADRQKAKRFLYEDFFATRAYPYLQPNPSTFSGRPNRHARYNSSSRETFLFGIDLPERTIRRL